MSKYSAEISGNISEEASSRYFLGTLNTDSKAMEDSKDLGKGPRSKIVEAILLLLYVRPMKSSEISRILGKQTKLISSYLSYWRSRGYVSYRSGYWFLTKNGEEYVKILIESLGIPMVTPQDVVLLAHKLINEQVSLKINDWIKPGSGKNNTEIQQFTVRNTDTKVGKQVHKEMSLPSIQKALSCVTKVLESKDLLEDEMLVLNFLIKHYVEWGSTYLYLDQIAEELHYQPSELSLILRKLQTKRLVYLYTDKRFGVRVGLGKSFKYILDQCISKA